MFGCGRGEKVSLRCDDGYGECCSVELACCMQLRQVNRTTASIGDFLTGRRVSSSKRCIDDAGTAVGAVACSIRNVDEGTGEGKIE